MTVTVGHMAPDFSLPDQDGVIHQLVDVRKQWLVLYFYPKDDTPGCTTEACAFRDLLPRFNQQRAVVWGISVDSVKKHRKFAEKYQLPFTLLSDEDKTVVERYGVWGEKKFMGKTYLGIARTTIIIDPQGRVAKVYEQVKPEGHAAAVAQDMEQLQYDA